MNETFNSSKQFVRTTVLTLALYEFLAVQQLVTVPSTDGPSRNAEKGH